jgi:hypothetical protein
MLRRFLAVLTATAVLVVLSAVSVAAATTFNIKLEPETAAPDASGHAKLQLFPEEGLVCYTIKWKGVDGPITGGHIHRLVDAGIEVSLFGGPLGTPTAYPGDKFKVSDCVSASEETISSILANPSAFYVNLHTDPTFTSVLHGPLE